MIGSSGLSVLLVLALCLFNDGYRLDNSGTARERLELAKRILAEVPLIDGCVQCSIGIRHFPKYGICFMRIVWFGNKAVQTGLASVHNGYRIFTFRTFWFAFWIFRHFLFFFSSHNDLPWNIRKFVHNRLRDFNLNMDLRTILPWSKSPWSQTDLPRLKQGMIGGQFWAAYVPCESQHLNAVQLTLEQIDVIKRLIDKYSNFMKLATSSAGKISPWFILCMWCRGRERRREREWLSFLVLRGSFLYKT